MLKIFPGCRGYYQGKGGVPEPQQGWFLTYLFVYSQLLAHVFVTVHPNHQQESSQCLKRPDNKLVQMFCCLNFFGYLAPTSAKFVQAVKFWLGHPIKLFLGM